MSPKRQKKSRNRKTTNENDINVVWCVHTTLSCVDSIYLIWQQTQNCLTAARVANFFLSYSLFVFSIWAFFICDGGGARARISGWCPSKAKRSGMKMHRSVLISTLLLACGQINKNLMNQKRCLHFCWSQRLPTPTLFVVFAYGLVSSRSKRISASVQPNRRNNEIE